MERKSEALSWLRANENESAFATNYFGTTEEAIEAVERLYAAGASLVEVVVSDDDRQRRAIEMEGGEYSETLLVHGSEAAEDKLAQAIRAVEPDESHFERGSFTWRLWWD